MVPDFITEGGAFMWVIVALSIMALCLIIERIVTFKTKYVFKASFFYKIKAKVNDGRVEDAWKQCLSSSHPLSKVLVVLLQNAHKRADEIESVGMLEIQKIIPEIQKRTNYINMIGNVATLAGLLGTIQGLILSFASLAGADPAKKAELLATGISTAMNTTAGGLVVAIPCIVAFTYITALEDSMLKKYDEITSDVIHNLTFNKKCKQDAAASKISA